MTDAAAPAMLRRVEHHMSTVISLAGPDLDDAVADRFFARIGELEDLLSRFRPRSELSRFAAGLVSIDDVAPDVREVLDRAEELRRLTRGDFEHEPRRRTGRPGDPVLDVDGVAKGWIVEEAALVLRLAGGAFVVNAGGDVISRGDATSRPWRVGVQHPSVRDGVLGVFELATGAVATSGRYERGAHLRARGAALASVTVVGPDLATADGLATAAFASGEERPRWWGDVDPAYGLLTMTADARLRWRAPADASAVRWTSAEEARAARAQARPGGPSGATAGRAHR